MIMSDLKGKIWMDGDLLEWSDAKIHVSHTLFIMALVYLKEYAPMKHLQDQLFLD